MMRRSASVRFAIPLLLLLSGCEIDYGDRLLGWVNQNAARLSRESADAELRMRWAQGHGSQALATRARLQVLAEAAELLRPPPSSESAEGPVNVTLASLQAEERMLSETSERLQSVRRETEALKISLHSWTGICTHERFFQENQLSRAGDLTRGIPAHKDSGPDGVSIGTTDYVLTRLFSDLFQTGRKQKQNERVDEAISRAATLSISKPELRERSRVRCEEELAIHRAFIRRSLQSLAGWEAAHALAAQSLARRRERLEARIIPLRIQGKESLIASEWKRQRSAWLAVLAESLAMIEVERVKLRRWAGPEKERLLAEDALAGRIEHLLRQAEMRSRELGMQNDPEVAQALSLLNSTGARP